MIENLKSFFLINLESSQPATICSKSATGTLEQGGACFQS